MQFCTKCGRKLSKKKIECHSRFYCNHCQIPLYENPVPATAGMVIDSCGRLLLVKRAVDPEKGKWCLPGGFLELGESPEQCILREIKEETSLLGKIGKFIGIESSKSVIHKSVLVIGYTIVDIQGDPKPGDDASEVGFFYPEELPEIAFFSHLRFIDSLKKKRVPHTFGAYAITSLDAVLLTKEVCRAKGLFIQYRDKCTLTSKSIPIARRIREITRDHNTFFIVNDKIDMALIADADGIHLGQDDIPIGEARRIIPASMIIGISTHSLEQARRAADEGADYIGIGPVFTTPTKSSYPPIGIGIVSQVMDKVSIPIVAIGGINLQNIYQLKKIGVKNVAMVREYQKDPYKVVKKVNLILKS